MESAMWAIPGERMKMGHPHVVPLSATSTEKPSRQLSACDRLHWKNNLRSGRTLVPNSAHLFEPNRLNRFSLGTKNKTLKYNQDGSLTLYFQNDSPGADKETNWVPAPKDAFSLYIRAYWPKRAILDRSWSPPPVTRTE